ncbi:Group II intron-encoded protein LtrA [subsurface metagenome]
MRKTTIALQDLRRKIYLKAKSETTWRFWGLYVHICKMETMQESYRLCKQNKGSAGIDGVTFEQVEKEGVVKLLTEIQQELISGTYLPMRNRIQHIPKGNGKTRKLGIPTIKDRIVQGAIKLILEPVFEADFQPGSFGYRPKRTAHQAIEQVANAIVQEKTRVIDIDLKSYFDTIRHDILLSKIAKRIRDDKVLHLLKLILKANGKKGVPQGSVISPLLSNIYLNELDKMLERANEVTREGKYTHITYARWADDLIILVDGYLKWDWLYHGVQRRLREELARLDVEINEEKTKVVDLRKGEKFGFLGFDFRRNVNSQGKGWPHYQPKMSSRTKLLRKLKNIFKRHISQPISRVIFLINPILRGWVNYFKVGHSSKFFGFVKDWVQKKIRRFLMRSKRRQGFGWKRWSRDWIYENLGVYNDYRVRRSSKDFSMQ